jgi:signal peptidase I
MMALLKWRQCLSIALISLSSVIAQSAWSEVSPADDQTLSYSSCEKIIYESIAKIKAGNTAISAQERKIIQLCDAKFSPPPNPIAPLPTASQCLEFVKIIWQVDSRKSTEIDFPEDKLMSIQRCTEIFQSYYMPVDSMSPTLKIKDRFMIDKTAYKIKSPQRGDIIVFNPTPILRQQKFRDKFVKRVIGIPGDRVEVRNGKVYINGTAIVEKYLSEAPQYNWSSTELTPNGVVPKGQYIVLGDNRNNYYDSHYWGFVDRNLIVGKMIWKFGDK